MIKYDQSNDALYQVLDMDEALKVAATTAEIMDSFNVVIANGTLLKIQEKDDPKGTVFVAWETSKHLPEWANKALQQTSC